MERLTIRNSDGSVSQPMDLRWDEALKRLAAYEDTGLEPEEIAIVTDRLVKAADTVEELIVTCRSRREVTSDG